MRCEKLFETSKNEYLHSTPEKYFNEVEPTYSFDKSLRISMPGCYTSMYRVKKKHALLENELFFTEKILTTAYNKGLLKEYPEEKIHEILSEKIKEINNIMPAYKSIRGVVLSEIPLIKTPTNKIKRQEEIKTIE